MAMFLLAMSKSIQRFSVLGWEIMKISVWGIKRRETMRRYRNGKPKRNILVERSRVKTC